MTEQLEVQKQETADVFEDYRIIACLAGLVFIKRDFAILARNDIDTAIKETMGLYFSKEPNEDHLRVFVEALAHPRLWEIIKQWWKTYDEARDWGEISPVVYDTERQNWAP